MGTFLGCRSLHLTISLYGLCSPFPGRNGVLARPLGPVEPIPCLFTVVLGGVIPVIGPVHQGRARGTGGLWHMEPDAAL